MEEWPAIGRTGERQEIRGLSSRSRSSSPGVNLGWIFKDGDAVVIDRQSSDVRLRKVAIEW